MGLFKKWKSKRVLFEDALKHIYNCQSRSIDATLESLGGTLKISAKRVVSIIERLERRKLVVISGEGIKLTPTGNAWALQVIRAHRIWESYLTEEVGVPLDKIHAQAEKMEHQLSAEQINELEEKLGYPDRDPHGDPIPTSKREIKEIQGNSLLDWPIGKLARIVHIEDEPPSIFTQILAQGLILDTCLKVMESGSRGLHIWTLLNEFWLAPIVAGNIIVDEAPAWFEEREVELASSLNIGEKGEILAVNAQGLNRRRLMDLGLVPGTIIEAIMTSAFKDPIAFKVRGAMTALRQEQAKQILIKRV